MVAVWLGLAVTGIVVGAGVLCGVAVAVGGFDAVGIGVAVSDAATAFVPGKLQAWQVKATATIQIRIVINFFARLIFISTFFSITLLSVYNHIPLKFNLLFICRPETCFGYNTIC